MSAPRDSIAAVSGPPEMAQPSRTESNAGQSQAAESAAGNKKKKHRGGKKKRNNRTRQNENGEQVEVQGRPSLLDAPTRSQQQSSFYRLGRNTSNTSLESEALLDHRDHGQVRNRRSSIGQAGAFTRPSIPFARHRGSTNSGQMAANNYQRNRLAVASGSAVMEEDEGGNERTPLLSSASRTHSRPDIPRTNSNSGNRYGTSHRSRRVSANSKASSRRRLDMHAGQDDEDYDVNNPPSVPTSPKLGSLDDIMIDELPDRAEQYERGRDAIINIDDDDRRSSDFSPEALRRRATVADLAERDVCFPGDASEMGDEDRQSQAESRGLRRTRRGARQWPDLEILEDWSREEKEERTHQEHVRAKKTHEPVLVGGRLRPGRTVWHREEEEEPFRFTYFNETFDGTIHARTISDLCQEGNSFKELFLPEPVELSDDSDDEEEEPGLRRKPGHGDHHGNGINGRVLAGQQSKHTSVHHESGGVERLRSPPFSENHTRSNTPSARNSNNATPRPSDKQKRYGARPTFWLDVLSPTDLEMKVISKAFGIHQLTTEDILMNEEREKVELFQNYYFVNYRSFEQDKDSEDYMDPINFYGVVFRDGVITFHHSMTPHPNNVRRRIRQLNDYMSPTADWISYALIDDITDVYTPRVAQIEKDVDDIDEEILYMHQTSADNAEGAAGKVSSSESAKKGGGSEAGGDKTAGQLGGDMLRRVGESRKKVQSLHRLLGNKADVIKGFAKRCNEGWEVAPRSEIGLYLGDIQDHIVTMSSNLAHYESLLSRAHSNYVAQINIRMNERAEQNADILGKLTVVGTIVLPMNIVTGMWGMNVWVPGQEYEGDLTWFWCITAGLLAFGFSCYFVAKKVYGIV